MSTRGARAVWLLGGVLPLVVVVVSTAGSPDQASLVGGGILAAALLGSALVLHLHWQLTHWPSTGLLSLGVGAVGAFLGVAHSLQLLDPGWVRGTGLAEAGTFAVVVGTVVSVGARRSTLDWSAPPAAIGATAGSGLAMLALVLPLAPGSVLPGGTVAAAAVMGAVVLVGLLLAWAVHSRLALPGTARRTLAAAIVLGATAQVSDVLDDAVPWLSLLLQAVAGAMVLTAALTLTAECLRDQRRSLSSLRSSLEQTSLEERHQQGAFHEIRSTVAGIAQASEMLQMPLPVERRESLAHMVDAELGRLSRLTQPRDRRHDVPVDLDQLLDTLVLRQRTHGQDVFWQPSGHRLQADADDVCEVLSILLENCRRHAPTGATLVEAGPGAEGTIRIVVSDTGPGIPLALQTSLFDWGARSPGSPGEGIGLSTARDLARTNGGDLTLCERGRARGASFALVLPAVDAPLRLDAEEVAGGRRTA